MSMCSYPIELEGAFIITPEVAEAINMIAEGIDDVTKLDDDYYAEIADPAIAVENIEDKPGLSSDSICTCSEFTGEAINPDTGETLEYHDDYLAYLAPEKTSSLFKAAYDSKEALADEYKWRLRDVLPMGFPIEKFIFDISGTYYA